MTSPNYVSRTGEPIGSDIYSPHLKFPLNKTNFESASNAVLKGTWRLSIRTSGGSLSVRPQFIATYVYERGMEDILVKW